MIIFDVFRFFLAIVLNHQINVCYRVYFSIFFRLRPRQKGRKREKGRGGDFGQRKLFPSSYYYQSFRPKRCLPQPTLAAPQEEDVPLAQGAPSA